ncbi:uncharacterized protein BXZ73DRAFT_102197 [Epithele typhae]|uniref:uncharacterized protein n=1 Tax=Epithele typhae TaxID=378194 RepID=UPI002007E951|nr:uncharacterized protein BXZ73DRAFT_102197 [Epithele typhae]KAH9929045.1 hypothetical protein BXZ73DRAFT_102197 [Epithele typhae]
MEPPPLPIDVTENVLDQLQAQGHLWALPICARVCNAWLPRCRFLIWQRVTISSLHSLDSIRAALERTPVLRSLVSTVRLEGNYGQYPHAAPAVLLPYLAHINTWEFSGELVIGGDRGRNLLGSLRSYAETKRLVVDACGRLISTLDVARLACGFPGLEELHLIDTLS